MFKWRTGFVTFIVCDLMYENTSEEGKSVSLFLFPCKSGCMVRHDWSRTDHTMWATLRKFQCLLILLPQTQQCLLWIETSIQMRFLRNDLCHFERKWRNSLLNCVWSSSEGTKVTKNYATSLDFASGSEIFLSNLKIAWSKHYLFCFTEIACSASKIFIKKK